MGLPTFLYLYPIEQYFKSQFLPEGHPNRKEQHRHYTKLINQTIDERYRQLGFRVVYALFTDTPTAQFIKLNLKDEVIDVGMTFAEHTNELPDKTYRYPDTAAVLRGINPQGILSIGGFHLWDCVQRYAKEATNQGINTIVDEELTELFRLYASLPDFKPNKYPNKYPNLRGVHAKDFLRARKDLPWMLQEIPR